jgi:hypothetical protein
VREEGINQQERSPAPILTLRVVGAGDRDRAKLTSWPTKTRLNGPSLRGYDARSAPAENQIPVGYG